MRLTYVDLIERDRLLGISERLRVELRAVQTAQKRLIRAENEVARARTHLKEVEETYNAARTHLKEVEETYNAHSAALTAKPATKTSSMVSQVSQAFSNPGRGNKLFKIFPSRGVRRNHNNPMKP